jgi:hypothetical protein
MRRRSLEVLRWAGLVAGTALCAAPAHAEPRDTRYTGLAFTYYFGSPDGLAANSADLSLGAMEHSVDERETISVMHLPLVQVPLIRAGQPVVAPIAAVVGAFHWLGTRTVLAPSRCVGKACASLPDLGAR